MVISTIMAVSPQFQRGEPGDRQNPGDDPKPDDDGRLFPALLLEVMVQRRHAEDAPSCHFEARDLNDDRDCLENEQPADDRQHELVLCNDADRPKGSADRQRSRVAHKDHGRWRIEPEETQARSNHRTAKDGELAGAGDVMDLQVVGKDRITGEIGNQAKQAAAIIEGTMASPSSPSVRLTAFEAPMITKTPNGTKNQPSSISTFLKKGKASALASPGGVT